MGFESLWTSAVRYRHASRHVRGLTENVYRDLLDHSSKLRDDLEELFRFLASDSGRTDANCSAVGRFFAQTEDVWNTAPTPLREILSDMSATLHDAIYAPQVAANFGSLPEQLLERIRQCPSS